MAFDWTLRLACLLLVCPFVVFVVNERRRPGGVADNVTSESLSVNNVELGSVNAGDRKEFSIDIRSHHPDELILLSPRSACNCIAATTGPIVIPPDSIVPVKFHYRAGKRPGGFDKSIEFHLQSTQPVSWSSRVSGHVVASIWSVPSEINLVRDSDEAKSVEVRICRRAGPSMETYESDSAGLSVLKAVKETGREDEATLLQLEIKSGAGDGSANLRVLSDEREVLLCVPIRWSTRPSVVFFPRRLSITRESRRDVPESRFHVVVRRKEAQAALLIETVVPWVQISKREDQSGATVLHLEISKASPREYGGAILRASTDNGRSWLDYEATVKSPL